MSEFFVRGADGVDYPATVDQIRSWLGEGRITDAQLAYDVGAARWTTVGEVLAAPVPQAEYFVRGDDGTNYPADLPSLRAWAAQQRLAPQQLVFDPGVGQWVAAAQLLGPHAFPASAAAAPRKRSRAAILLSILMVLLLIGVRIARRNDTVREKLSKALFDSPAAEQAEAKPEPAVRTLPAGQWVNDGPYAASIEHLAVSPADPNVVLALGTHSVFRSTDGGASWKRVLISATGNMDALRFSADGARAYAGGSRFHVSRDAGATWTETDRSVEALAVTPEGLFAKSGNRLAFSSDGGATWSDRTAPASSSVRLVPTPDRLFAFGEKEAFESTDGARSWRRLPYEAESMIDAAFVSPSTLYVSSVEGLRRSSDLGRTWTAVSKFAGGKVYRLRTAGAAILAQTDDGWFRSDDAAASWNEFAAPAGTSLRTLEVDARSPQQLIGAGYDDRVYRTNDNGGTWSQATEGMAGWNVRSLVAFRGGVAAASLTDAYAASSGRTWRNVIRAPLLSFSETVSNLAAANDRLYAIRGVISHRVERSTDGGTTWSPWGNSVSANMVAGHPTIASRVYASTADGLQVSNDDGATWQMLAPKLFFSKLLIGPGDGPMYALSEYKLKSSEDGGKTWKEVPRFRTVNDIGLTAAGTLCVAHQQGFTCLGAKRDRRFGSGLPDDELSSLAAHPSDPAILLAGSTESGVWVTRDGGATWSRFGPEGGPVYVSAVVFDRDDPNVVHVGTAGESVFSIRTQW